MSTCQQIGLAGNPGFESPNVLNGIIEYSRQFGPFRLLGTFGGEFAGPHLRQRQPVDGLLICAQAWQKPILHRSGIPIVSIGQLDGSPLPYQVFHDHVAVGKMAAEEFLARGMRRLAYCAYAWVNQSDRVNLGSFYWDQQRMQGFLSTARAAGAQTFVYNANLVNELFAESEWTGPLTLWIRSLPKPVGIMAANDYRARLVLLAAELAGCRVPDDVAVIGVDNVEWARVNDPPLSSIELDGFRVGYVAMETLHKLILGQHVEQPVVNIPPHRLVRRQSSDVLAIDDADVIDAVRYIEEHATTGISVDQVVDAVAVSRRGLERRFRQSLHCSILDSIRRVQVEKAKSLLCDPAVPYPRIAKAAGFHSSPALSTIFHRVTGMTPSAFRAAELAASATAERGTVERCRSPRN